MESNDIIMVLSQTSELHAKINHAMERVSEYGREINNGETVPVINGVNGKCMNDDINHLPAKEAVAMEAKNLASIRDALDALQDQLYCLQILQDQQQADKEAALSDMEESRRILVQRLRKHRGREWEVVQEALAFVGEPVEENKKDQEKEVPSKYNCEQDPNGPSIKLLAWIEETEEELVSKVEDSKTHKKINGIEKDQIESQGFFKSASHRLRKSMGSVVTLAAKTALVAAAIVTLVAVSKVGKHKLSNSHILKALPTPSSPPTDQKLPLMEKSSQPGHDDVLEKFSSS